MRTWVLLSMSLLAGCSSFELGTETAGELRHVTFAYQTGRGCFFGCSLQSPMLRGTQEIVSADGPLSLSGATVSIEPKGVVQLGDIDSRPTGDGRQVLSLPVSAIGVGETRLSITDAKGALIDRVTLRVDDAARVSAEWAVMVPDPKLGSTEKNWTTSTDVQLSRQNGVIDFSAYDAGGRQLQAARGFATSFSQPGVVKVNTLTSDDYLLELEPTLTGSTTLTATSQSGVSTKLTITTQAP
jgi:hypothetical protein